MRSQNNKIFFYARIIPLIVFLFFIPSLNNGFVNWDDPYVLWKNPLIKDFSWQGVLTIFTAMWNGQYHRFIPLSMVFFAGEFHFFALNPFGYHLISVLLHSLNSLLVFLLIYFLTLKPGASAVAALLFGLHPFLLQPVVWVAAQTYPVGAFFFLSAVVLYLWGTRIPTQKPRFTALAFLFFFLSLLFYSQLVLSLPFVLLAIDYYLNGRITWKDVFYKSPFFLMTFYFGGLVLKAGRHTGDDYMPFFLTHHLPLMTRLNLSAEAIWMYAYKCVFPFPLSCWYPTDYYLQGRLFLYTLMIGAIALVLLLYRKHERWRICFLGLIWFLITIAPFLHIYGLSESIINDRYSYLSSIGLLLVFIGVWENLWSRIDCSLAINYCLKGAIFIWFTFIIILSAQQIGIWHDSGKLWSNFISQYPRFNAGYLSRSEYFLSIRKPRLALQDINAILKLDPHNAAAYQNKVHALFQLGQWQAETEACNKVIELNPGFVPIYVDQGAAYFILGEDDKALDDFNKALQKNPREVNALFNRGIVYLNKKEYRHAWDDFQKVLIIDPSNENARIKSVLIEHSWQGK